MKHEHNIRSQKPTLILGLSLTVLFILKLLLQPLFSPEQHDSYISVSNVRLTSDGELPEVVSLVNGTTIAPEITPEATTKARKTLVKTIESTSFTTKATLETTKPFTNHTKNEIQTLIQSRTSLKTKFEDLKWKFQQDKYTRTMVKNLRDEADKNVLKNFTESGVGVNFIKLKNYPDIGISYHASSNIVNVNGKYAVISANAVHPRQSISYVFNIPFTCASWISIGYGCFVIMPYYGLGVVEVRIELEWLKLA